MEDKFGLKKQCRWNVYKNFLRKTLQLFPVLCKHFIFEIVEIVGVRSFIRETASLETYRQMHCIEEGYRQVHQKCCANNRLTTNR